MLAVINRVEGNLKEEGFLYVQIQMNAMLGTVNHVYKGSTLKLLSSIFSRKKAGQSTKKSLKT